jgi:hypothetical protein
MDKYITTRKLAGWCTTIGTQGAKVHSVVVGKEGPVGYCEECAAQLRAQILAQGGTEEDVKSVLIPLSEWVSKGGEPTPVRNLTRLSNA